MITLQIKFVCNVIMYLQKFRIRYRVFNTLILNFKFYKYNYQIPPMRTFANLIIFIFDNLPPLLIWHQSSSTCIACFTGRLVITLQVMYSHHQSPITSQIVRKMLALSLSYLSTFRLVLSDTAGCFLVLLVFCETVQLQYLWCRCRSVKISEISCYILIQAYGQRTSFSQLFVVWL